MILLVRKLRRDKDDDLVHSSSGPEAQAPPLPQPPAQYPGYNQQPESPASPPGVKGQGSQRSGAWKRDQREREEEDNQESSRRAELADQREAEMGRMRDQKPSTRRGRTIVQLADLPPGWSMKICERDSGRLDYFYISPENKIIRSLKDLPFLPRARLDAQQSCVFFSYFKLL